MVIKRLKEVEGWEQHIIEDVGLEFKKDNVKVLIRGTHGETYLNHQLVNEDYNIDIDNIDKYLKVIIESRIFHLKKRNNHNGKQK